MNSYEGMVGRTVLRAVANWRVLGLSEYERFQYSINV